MKTTARDMAIAAHGDQKYGDHPYAVHLDAVASLARTAAPAELLDEVVAAGYLHDAIEDTALTHAEIAAAFGPVVADAVRFCSDQPGPNRKARKRATYRHMRAAVNNALLAMPTPDSHAGVRVGVLVKLSDRICNLEATVADGKVGLAKTYLREAEVFRLAIASPLVPEDLLTRYDAVVAEAQTLVERSR